MASFCSAEGAADSLVRGLIGVVDCNVEGLVRGGYATLFAPGGGLAAVLTGLLVAYIALVGYRLMLGMQSLSIGGLALMAVKVGAVVALTTGWASYQAIVYEFLFRGPEQLADLMLKGVQPPGSMFRGDVFDGLQTVFDALNAFSAAWGGPHDPAAVSASATSGFGAQALTAAAVTLLLSSLGVLLAAKVVLGLLLATGPIFIALLLFPATRGVFEGWLRASVAVAFVPLAVCLSLGVGLTVLEPFLILLRDQVAQGNFALRPVYDILLLVIVFAVVTLGATIAGGVIGLGLRLPRGPAPLQDRTSSTAPQTLAAEPYRSRAARVAAAAAAMERRESSMLSQVITGPDRRTAITVEGREGRRAPAPAPFGLDTRLGQAGRRSAGPRTRRLDARSGR